MTCKDAMAYAKKFIDDIRVNEYTTMNCPECSRCKRIYDLPTSIGQIAKTGRCCWCELMMKLKPAKRLEVDRMLHEIKYVEIEMIK